MAKDLSYEKLERIEMELGMSKIQIEQEQKNITQLRQQRAQIYEQQAENDADISQKFDDYKVPKTANQKSYDDAKQTIKVVYYTLRENPKGLRMDEIFDILATRNENDIRDAVWFLVDGGDVQHPTLDWKLKV